MGNENWKTDLRTCFENIRVLERCKKEARNHFGQFCEFIAEPAFEALVEELKEYEIRARFRKSKQDAISFQADFANSRVDNFDYTVLLPKNSVELKLILRIRGRKARKGALEEKEEPFMPQFSPADILKVTKEELLQDVIERYKDFNFEALVSPE